MTTAQRFAPRLSMRSRNVTTLAARASDRVGARGALASRAGVGSAIRSR